VKIVPDHRRVRTAAIPMTSMIDVVFLLLIFFMVTATFASPEDELSAGLQAEGRGAATEDLQPQIVDVRLRNGRTVYEIGAHSARTRAELTAVLRRLPTEPGVIIRVAGDVPVAAPATAMQAAADAGFRKRTYVPASPQGGEG
jgi:biopolymer transport protein ExbD